MSFFTFCCRLLTFTKSTFSKDSFRNTIRVSNGLVSVQTVAKAVSRQQKLPLARKEFRVVYNLHAPNGQSIQLCNFPFDMNSTSK